LPPSGQPPDAAVYNTQGRITCWDVAAGRARITLPERPGLVTGLAFSPDGKTLAASTAASVYLPWREIAQEKTEVVERPGYVRLWDLDQAREREAVEHPGGVWALAWTGDGHGLAFSAGAFGEVRSWDQKTGHVRTVGRGHTAPVSALAFNRGGALLSVSWDGTVKAWVWDGPPEPLVLRDSYRSVEGIAFSPDGRWLVLSAGGGAAVLDQTTRTWEGQGWWGTQTAFTPDGRHVVTGSPMFFGLGSPVQVLEVGTWRRRTRMRGGQHEVPGSVAVSPDGRTVALVPSQSDGAYHVKLWDLATGREKAVFKRPADSNGTAVTTCVAYAPDGRLLATGGRGGGVTLWDPSSGQVRRELRGHTQSVRAVVFSPDGQTLISAGSSPAEPHRPGEVILWDLATARARATLRGHRGPVSGVAVAPGGKSLATAGDDATVQLWNLATGERLAVLRGARAPLKAVAFSPDGTTLAAATMNGAVHFWQAAAEGEVKARAGF
jgi:WD40 repeat protein